MGKTVAVIMDTCGRCANTYPRGVVDVAIQDPETFRQEAMKRIGSYVDVSYRE